MARTSQKKSSALKKKIATQDIADEKNFREAVVAVVTSGLTPTGRPRFSLRAAANQFNVSSTILTARYNGRGTRKEGHESQQKLSKPKEVVLKEWIGAMGRCGLPLTLTAIAEYASFIVGDDVKVSWAHQFRARHPDLKAQ
ncbi:hypothetical protein B0H17DRAFT_1138593 [Mycena rosella]|uniref:HTH CENPB-type domain-containing protein n=1 Tax=Mycena rosella TaxID=1033263 RepID=A0AAD7D635_MYCRO|nr:hypothetical protein B0H17DRAFT_1138593 [Mycena rosella]